MLSFFIHDLGYHITSACVSEIIATSFTKDKSLSSQKYICTLFKEIIASPEKIDLSPISGLVQDMSPSLIVAGLCFDLMHESSFCAPIASIYPAPIDDDLDEMIFPTPDTEANKTCKAIFLKEILQPYIHKHPQFESRFLSQKEAEQEVQKAWCINQPESTDPLFDTFRALKNYIAQSLAQDDDILDVIDEIIALLQDLLIKKRRPIISINPNIHFVAFETYQNSDGISDAYIVFPEQQMLDPEHYHLLRYSLIALKDKLVSDKKLRESEPAISFRGGLSAMFDSIP